MHDRSYMSPGDSIALLKTAVDVHTLGLSNAAGLLGKCGFRILTPSPPLERALERLERVENLEAVDSWIKRTRPDHLALSYRLDPNDGARVFRLLYRLLREGAHLKEQGGSIRFVGFAGLPEACRLVESDHPGRIILFSGDESPREVLERFGVPPDLYPPTLVAESSYDKRLFALADRMIRSGDYEGIPPPRHDGYPEYGTRRDTLVKRLDRCKELGTGPVLRSHIGPYLDDRSEALRLYREWVRRLAATGYLDVLSIGSSQLTQCAFEQDWTGRANGGGVPVRTREEYHEIYESSRPMLVRTYSGTVNVPVLARIHEESLNIAWHAFSFWWFNKLDGRGPNGLLENLVEHFQAASYAVSTNKPVEANVPHHFAFRGCDDATYVVSAYLAAKAMKRLGVRTFVLQNMLNTPRLTWGIQDIAKARALLGLLRTLEDGTFRLVYETRAGLSYFSADMEKAKRQVAAVGMLMDEIEPDNPSSPDIIHVVGYSEANFLADPSVVDESIRITLHALAGIREARRKGEIPDSRGYEEIGERADSLREEASMLIAAMERRIPDLYTPNGFWRVFAEGWLPVPQLWGERDVYPSASDWAVELMNGAYCLVDKEGRRISPRDRIEIIERRLAERGEP